MHQLKWRLVVLSIKRKQTTTRFFLPRFLLCLSCLGVCLPSGSELLEELWWQHSTRCPGDKSPTPLLSNSDIPNPSWSVGCSWVC